jgi:hypothetical protein
MITVTGGVYREKCFDQPTNEILGSGGRAAIALTDLAKIRLYTYRAKEFSGHFHELEQAFLVESEGLWTEWGIEFDYLYSLGAPRITPTPATITQHPDLIVEGDVILRFGMLEGSARISGNRVVYDPQSAFNPRPFSENGSTAKTLAVILNREEGWGLTGKNDPGEIAEVLLSDWGAQVVVVKMGTHGAMVVTREGSPALVPAYRSEQVWKLGSGDVFSAVFTYFWGLGKRDPIEAAELASRATAYYCAVGSVPLPSDHRSWAADAPPTSKRTGKVYLASPFFTLGERWLVNQVRDQLMSMGMEVFSPLHDVGEGPAISVAKPDLDGLDECSVVLAIMNGNDPGTIFEVGYAIAKEKPIICLAQNVPEEDLKMPAGSGCRVYNNIVTAIYQTVWAEP